MGKNPVPIPRSQEDKSAWSPPGRVGPRGQEEETLMDEGVRHFLTAVRKEVLVVLLVQLPSEVSHIPLGP